LSRGNKEKELKRFPLYKCYVPGTIKRMNEDSLQKWALGAEIVGAIAVVITLIFLILETKENTDAIRAQTYHQLTAELNEQRRYSLEPELSQLLYQAATEGIDTLNAPQQIQVIQLHQGSWAVYESAFYSFKRGTLGDDEWDRYFRSICRNRLNQAEFWERESGPSLSSNISETFRFFVDTSCTQ
jgi:hypothetical protein